MTAADQYLLLWKGRQSGPFNMARIQEMLLAGDINRMHQIHVDGRWQILDDFLEKLRGADQEAKRAEEQFMREAAMRRQLEPPSREPANREGEPSPSSASQTQQALSPPPFTNASPDPFGAAAPFPPTKSRMSGFAITAFVLGMCSIIPFVDFVSWLPALVFGHIALIQMNADDSLKGRGLAIAGLALTYFFVVVITTVVVLCLVNNRPLPIHF